MFRDRAFLQPGPRPLVRPLAAIGAVALLALACTQQPPAAPSPTAATTAPKTAAQGTTAPIGAASPTIPPAPKAPAAPVAKSAASPSPAAKTAAAPSPAAKVASPQAATRGTPTGKASYVLDFSFVPTYNDPQENQSLVTPYSIQYALHDALVKHLPGQPFSPSLAESYEIAPDYRSATFKLRPNLTFHNGDPVTPEDVIFTFNNYKGANAKILKDKTEKVEAVDNRTVKFTFKEPFLDFLVLYGTPASGAGWIVPAKYYQEVGPDGFKQKPVGAGPFKFVRQIEGQEIELEAFENYWRKTPGIKTLVLRGIGEGSTRVATFQAGEVDFVYNIPSLLLENVENDPNAQMVPVLTNASFWLEMPGYEQPDSPFNNPKVREAVSLAIDRQALIAAESPFSLPHGNWIPENWPGAIELPTLPHNIERAKQLLAEAGYPDGFEVEQLTPLPPYFSLAERIIGQLGQVGIRTRLNQMERAAFTTKLTEGQGALPGMILNISGAPGDAANRIRAFALCPPQGTSSRTCDATIDQKFQQYEASANPEERQRLLTEIQNYIVDNHIFIPIYRLANVSAQGPRVANNTEELFGAIPQWPYMGPYEDVRLK